jgi:hypothetical protein
MTILVAIFIAIVARFKADEVKAWSTGYTTKCSARLWPGSQNNIRSVTKKNPGEIFKFVYFIGLLSASLEIRKAVIVETMDATLSASFRRAIDIVFSSIMLFMLVPYLVAIAIAVRLETGGPVFYLSDRIGKSASGFKSGMYPKSPPSVTWFSCLGSKHPYWLSTRLPNLAISRVLLRCVGVER